MDSDSDSDPGQPAAPDEGTGHLYDDPPAEPADAEPAEAPAPARSSQRWSSAARLCAALMAVKNMTDAEISRLCLSSGNSWPEPGRVRHIMADVPVNLRQMPAPQATADAPLPSFQPCSKRTAKDAGLGDDNDIQKAHRCAADLAKRTLSTLAQRGSSHANPSLQKGYKLQVHAEHIRAMLTVLRGGVGRAGVPCIWDADGKRVDEGFGKTHNVWRATWQVDFYKKRGKKREPPEPFVLVAAADIEGPPEGVEYKRHRVQHMVRNCLSLKEAALLSPRFAAAYQAVGLGERATYRLLRAAEPKLWRPRLRVRKQRDEPDAQSVAQQIIGLPKYRCRTFHTYLLGNADLAWMALHLVPTSWGLDLTDETVSSDAGTIEVAEMLKGLRGIGFKGEPVPALVCPRTPRDSALNALPCRGCVHAVAADVPLDMAEALLMCRSPPPPMPELVIIPKSSSTSSCTTSSACCCTSCTVVAVAAAGTIGCGWTCPSGHCSWTTLAGTACAPQSTSTAGM